MPPNFKFPTAAQLALVNDEQDLIDAASQRQMNTGGSSTAPPPLTLETNKIEKDDTFIFHDIEANSHQLDAASSAPDHSEVRELELIKDDNKIIDANHHHRVIKHLASQIMDPLELSIDDRRLSRAVRDAGEFSYGVIACEVWLLNADNKLVRPKGGWWHNSKLYQNYQQSTLLDELEVTDPEPVLPGVDLPGILWSEAAARSDNDVPKGGLTSRTGSFFTGHKSTEDLPAKDPHRQHNCQQHHHLGSTLDAGRNTSPSHGLGRTGPSMERLMHLTLHHQHNPHALFWRDLHSIAEDPDSAKTLRLQKLMDAGIGVAAGIPFHVRNHQGLVIYFARSHTQTHLISDVANDAYLKASAQMIGHAAALSEIRRASVEARRRHNMDASQRFRKNLIENQKKHADKIPQDFACFGPDGGRSWKPEIGDAKAGSVVEEDSTSVLEDLPLDKDTLLDQYYHGIQTWFRKCKGGNLQVPPAMTFRQSLWTVFGAFCGLLVLSSLNEYYKILSNEDYFLLIGPFGALMTLQYGLTAAPASQPRNVVLGQAVSGAVSLAFTYIPESILAVWIRRAVGPAVAIGVMVKCGVTHPPAGAHAVLYASGKYNFGFYALVVLSSAISVVPATIVNNMSSKRQYPTYWTFLKLPKKNGEEPKNE